MYKIEKGIPVPESRCFNKWPFAEMNIGDSFLLPSYEERHRAASAAQIFRRRNGNFYLSIRKVEGGWRAWRVNAQQQLNKTHLKTA